MADETEEPTTAADHADGMQSEFFSDSGPGFNPETSPEAPEPDELGDLEEETGWTPEGVYEFLQELQAPAFNNVLNPLLGVSSVDWRHREKRLRSVAPVIAREWNKIPQIKQLAGVSDRGIILNYLFIEYLGPRSLSVVGERRELARARAEQEAEVTTPPPNPSGAFVAPEEPLRPVRPADELPPDLPGRNMR